MGRISSRPAFWFSLMALTVGAFAIACAKGEDADIPMAATEEDGGPGGSSRLPPKGDGTDGDDDDPDAGKNVQADGAPKTTACEAALAAASFDFESDQGWKHAESDAPSSFDWERDVWGNGTASHGTACASGKCFGSELTRNYPQCSRSYLVSPAIDLAACKDENIELAFDHAFAFWSTGAFFDGGVLEISADDGTTWSVPDGSYPGTVNIRDFVSSFSGDAWCEPRSFGIDGKKGFVGKQTTTQEFAVTVANELLTAKLRVRFSMGAGVSLITDSAANARNKTDFGWRIDNVHFVKR
jgi:hypothetical protein